MLTLRGVNYGSTFCAVGARGFYGEGYPFHKIWRFFGMTWEGTSFAGKTMTLQPRTGNMPLRADGVTPKELFPSCIWGSLARGGEMVNQVGLSNLGLYFYLATGRYNKITKPFMISVMLMEQTEEARRQEILKIIKIVKAFMPFGAPFALQINFACPNTGHDISVFHKEMVVLVKLAKDGLVIVPIVANVNALMPTEILVGVAAEADALWIGNTIPFGDSRSTINWKRFGVDATGKPVSPLSARNPEWAGGLSSPDCLWDTEQKVKDVRRAGVSIPIVAGNGIRTKAHLHRLRSAGADAVFVGSLGTVRPWHMRSVISRANQLFT